MNKALPLLMVSLLLLICPVVTPGQTTGSTSAVTGAVTDTTGAVIPGASVTLTDTKTSKTLTTTTDDQGIYRFNQVPPGQGYTLTFTSQGFQTLVKEAIVLGVGQTETHNVRMTAGQISESITVTSSGEATLNTTDASIGNVIDERRLRELPIAIRNSPAALIGLQPGVVGDTLGIAGAQNNRAGSVTGSRSDQSNITVDGIDANDQTSQQFGATIGNAPIDSIQEFRTVSTNPSAAEGRSSGGQIQLITKSGTNDFSGNIRWYNRTGATAANSFFSNRLGRNAAGDPIAPKPKLIRNQFGGSLGGPIVRDKLFFFQDYEGRRDLQEVAYLRLVPLEHFRNGGLAYINNTAGCTASSRLNTSPNCITVLTPAQVAALDPRGTGSNQALLSFIRERYPAANDLSAGDGVNTGGFRFNAPATRKDNTFVTRIDWNMTNAQKLFGRFNIARRIQTDTANTVAQQFPGDPETGVISIRDYSWVVGHTWAARPNIVNQLTVGASVGGAIFPAPFKPQSPNEYGLPAAVTGGSFGAFGIAAPFAGIDDQTRVVTTPTIRDDLTWTIGSHSIALGGSFKPISQTSTLTNDFNFIALGLGGGLSGLDASLRPGNIRTDTATSTNYDAAFAFLLGRFAYVQTNFVYDVSGTPQPSATGKARDYRYNEYELYFQDNWKVTNSLSLTAGVRWHYYPAPYEANGFQACNDVDFRQLIAIRFRNAAQGLIGYEQSLAAEPLLSYDLCGKANNARGFYEPDLNNFGPRLSFAWNPSFKDGILGKILGDRKTSFRGGGAVIFDRVGGALSFVQDQGSYLFDNSRIANFGSGDPTTSLLNDPRFTALGTLPVTNAPPAATRPVTPYLENGALIGNAEGQFNYVIDQQFKLPYSIQYSFGFQRELPGNFILEASYVGRQGRQLFTQADAAQILDYRDPVSGQTLLTAFNALQAQLLAGLPGSQLTDQPFLRNQMNSALQATFHNPAITCETAAPLYGLPAGLNCTRLFVALNRNLITVGNVADSVQVAHQFGWLNPNVGLSGQFSTNAYVTNLGSSSYDGMLLSLRRRFSNGLQFDFNYTLSHAIDNQSNIANTAVFGLVCDIRDLRVCRGNSDFDIRHLVNANFIYELPFGRDRSFLGNSSGVVDAIVGGWTVTGIFMARSGLPFNAVTNSFPTAVYWGTTQGGAPAVLNGDGSALQSQLNVTPSGTIQLFADPSTALAQLRNPRGGEMGNRNNLRGPGFWNVDLAVLKNFRLPWSENHKLQLRWEMYNAFNHNNFNLPSIASRNINGTTFGQITSSANFPREMQFAIRYEF